MTLPGCYQYPGSFGKGNIPTDGSRRVHPRTSGGSGGRVGRMSWGSPIRTRFPATRISAFEGQLCCPSLEPWSSTYTQGKHTSRISWGWVRYGWGGHVRGEQAVRWKAFGVASQRDTEVCEDGGGGRFVVPRRREFENCCSDFHLKKAEGEERLRFRNHTRGVDTVEEAVVSLRVLKRTRDSLPD